MKKRRKNPHAMALGRLGGLVLSEAKRRANRENGRKGGLVKGRKKQLPRDATPVAHGRTGAGRRGERAVASIRARFGYRAIGLGYGGLRYSAPALR